MPRFPSSAVLTTLSILEFLGASRQLGAIGLARHVPQPSDGSRRSRERVGRRHPQNEDSYHPHHRIPSPGCDEMKES